jgi:hypothetical protein
MSKPAWHSTFQRMRGAGRRRTWMTWAEYQGLLVTLVGVSLSPYHIKQACRTCPPVRVHGGKRYEDRHVQMAVGYARAKGLVWTPTPQLEEVTQ